MILIKKIIYIKNKFYLAEFTIYNKNYFFIFK
jgi:hypothetical protein